MSNKQSIELAGIFGIEPDMFISYSQYESVLNAIKYAYNIGTKDRKPRIKTVKK
jgi:hypothetical protein